mmetsp:Transcript_29349/g.57614  ORF Transcript_29349/g.57614 Transcript_29349/m.57614 type:complete len:108 (+) Transcript_29349:192-515(+)
MHVRLSCTLDQADTACSPQTDRQTDREKGSHQGTQSCDHKEENGSSWSACIESRKQAMREISGDTSHSTALERLHFVTTSNRLNEMNEGRINKTSPACNGKKERHTD